MNETMTPREFGKEAGIGERKAYKLTKLEDTSLRPPGFWCGREYRIWKSDIDEYLHGGMFAKAMEVIA